MSAVLNFRAEVNGIALDNLNVAGLAGHAFGFELTGNAHVFECGRVWEIYGKLASSAFPNFMEYRALVVSTTT